MEMEPEMYCGSWVMGRLWLTQQRPEPVVLVQHYPSLVSQNGSQDTLVVWDNGNNRPVDSFGNVCNPAGPPQCYSRGVIFQIDESTKAAMMVWQDLPGFLQCLGRQY